MRLCARDLYVLVLLADFGRIVNVESFIRSTESQDGMHVLRNAINAPKPEVATAAQGDDEVVVITDTSPPDVLLPVPVAVQHQFENQLLSKVELQQGQCQLCSVGIAPV